MRRAGLAAALAFALALGARAGTDPLETWLADLRSEDPAARARAAEAATHFDAGAHAALPALIETLGHTDVSLRRAVAEAIGDVAGPEDARAAGVPLVGALGDTDPLVRAFAGRALLALGPQGHAILKEAAESGGERAEAARRALVEATPSPEQTQPDPTRVLVESSESRVVFKNLETGEFHSFPKNAPARARPDDPHTLELQRQNREAKRRRREAERRIAAVAGNTPSIPALARLLSDRSPDVRYEAVRRLHAMKLEAAPAALPIGEQLVSEDPYMRQYAAFTLTNIGPEAAAARPAIARALASKYVDARRRAVALVSIVGFGPDLHDPLRARCGDADATVRTEAAALLARAGLACEGAVPNLLASLTDESSQVRAAAASALADSPPETTAELEPLIRALGDEDAAVRASARRALDALGERALPALRVVSSDPERRLADAASELLHRLELDEPLARADAARRPQYSKTFQAPPGMRTQ